MRPKSKPMLKRTLRYGQKIFGLLCLLEMARDHRRKPQIPFGAFSLAILILFLCRLPSLNALDQYRGQSRLRRLLGYPLPCADQIGNVSEVFDLSCLRGILGQMYRRLGRNKVLKAIRGHRLAVVDGHEINHSYKRCCPNCQQRAITINGKKRIQYYHRAVIFQLLGDGFRLLLDLELLRPKEDEGTAALRLIERVLQNHARSFDILLGDGLYPQARFFKLLRRHKKHALVVLKDDRRDILKDARGLFRHCRQITYRQGCTVYQCRDVEDIRSWDSYPASVRIVQSIETTTVRERIGHQWRYRQLTTEWLWVTTLTANEVPTRNVVFFGHERWRIENEGFNELCNHWHANHYFRHDPTSITAFWLILFMAHALFHCFLRNLKPALRADHTLLYWAQQIFADFVAHYRQFFSSA
jgi:hypothetical protein